MSLLNVSNLTVSYGPHAVAVDNLSFQLDRGDTLGIVGESGCGKSTTGLAIMRILDAPGRITTGTLSFDGEAYHALPERAMRRLRGKRMAMIFQDPMSSLNPVYTIGDQLLEAVLLHESISHDAAWQRCVSMLEHVHLPNAAACMDRYPHELSGGMKQRIVIAMALLCQPDLIIADEPTTALDVTVQAQILALLKELQVERGLSMILITHDLSVVAETAHRVLVMYAARAVEAADVQSLFAQPLHPYTQGLFRCLPRADKKLDRLMIIPGNVPDLENMPAGCRFHPRCPLATERCRIEQPILEEKRPGHRCACHMVEVQS